MILMFPGQGSQYLGMGKDLYNNFIEARLLFEEVSDVLKYNLSKVIFGADQEKLNSTKYTQPAIMAVSIAVVKVLEQELGKKITKIAKYVIGHSLGEYSALCAAGALSVSDGAKLLQARGEAMENAFPSGKGGMVVLLGATLDQAEEIINQIDDCEIANDNGGGQIVLSCLIDKVQEIKIIANKIMIRKVLQLPVSGPFHSTFMQPAAEKMEEVLEGVTINNPSVPIISNVKAASITEVSKIKECLIKQIVQKVRWRESILYCTQKKETHYIELGPGNILANLVKRINKSNIAISINTSEHIKNFIDTLN